MSRTREITITYYDHGIVIEKQTPKDERPIRVYTANATHVIPPHIADMWLNYSKIHIIDMRTDTDI